MWCELEVIFGRPVNLRVVRGNLCIAEPNAPATVHNMVICLQIAVAERVAPKLARWRFLCFTDTE